MSTTDPVQEGQQPEQTPPAPVASTGATEQPTPEQPTPEQPTPEPDRPPAGADEDLAGELRAMQAKITELEQRANTGQLTLAQADSELADKVAELRKSFEDWPQKGDERPQPWDLQAHGLPQPGVTRDYLPGGQADELSPVVVAHGKPLLAPGMAGEPVHELAQLLARVGYATSVTEGRNFSMAFDDSVAAAVASFKRDYHVSEDPSQFPANSGQHEVFVGPYVWEALLRAAELAG